MPASSPKKKPRASKKSAARSTTHRKVVSYLTYDEIMKLAKDEADTRSRLLTTPSERFGFIWGFYIGFSHAKR